MSARYLYICGQEKEQEQDMEKARVYETTGDQKERLVKLSDGHQGVAVHHGHLDSLVGSLMHVCELTGDREQREALKSEIKMRTRDWLNDQYAVAGYTD